MRRMAEQGIPVRRLDGAAAERLYPSLGTDDLAWVLHEPEAAVLRAQRAVQALARAARRRGAELIRARAVPRGASVQLDDGRVLEGELVVWCCGGWLAGLFPGLVTLTVTVQELLFLDGGPAWRDAPGWVDYDRATYGTGDIDGLGVKAAW